MGVQTLFVLLTAVSLSTANARWFFGNKTCNELLAQSPQNAEALGAQFIAQKDAFTIGQGKGMVQLKVDAYFSQDYIRHLHKELMKTLEKNHWYDPIFNVAKSIFNSGTVQLIVMGQDVSAELLTKHPHITAELLKPIYDYANKVLENTNAILPEPEKNKLQIEILRIALSDGNHRQVNENWHIDSFRYMTSLTNLMGAGTLLDADGPKPVNQENNQPSPANVEEIPAMHGIVASSFLRYYLFPAKGAEPINHKAQGGVRMSIIIFFKPINMTDPGDEIYSEVVKGNIHTPEVEPIRMNLIKRFFGF